VSPKAASRPENPKAVRRCQRKEQDEEDVFSEESKSVLALGTLHLTISEEDNVGHNEWEWPISTDFQKHGERAALLRPIPYEMTSPVDDSSASAHKGKALSVNISSGGMLILMDQVPTIEQVMKVYVPTPISAAETPTLAEVRWTRRLPFGTTNGNVAYFVGLKFMF
jgi:hypothetical protein